MLMKAPAGAKSSLILLALSASFGCAQDRLEVVPCYKTLADGVPSQPVKPCRFKTTKLSLSRFALRPSGFMDCRSTGQRGVGRSPAEESDGERQGLDRNSVVTGQS